MITTANKSTFRKHEKICNQNQIDKLFSTGKSLAYGLFRLIYIETEKHENLPIQVLVAVSKKNLRLAVSRNRMKRLIREAYRKGKYNLLINVEKEGKQYDIAFVFTGKQCVSQTDTCIAINALLDRLIQIHEKAFK